VKTPDRVIPGGAPIAKKVVADLLCGVEAADLAGYIVVGFRKDHQGFYISSNARDHAAEARILRNVARTLETWR